MTEAINDLQRSYGTFPREHQYASLETLEHAPDNPEQEVFFNASEKLVKQWSGDKFAGLYLYGEPGTGKTHAAIGLARALHEEGAHIHYRHVPSWKQREIHNTGFDSGTTIIPPHMSDWEGTRSSYDSSLVSPPFVTSVYENGRHSPTHDKSVLILDDYKPHARDYVTSAIEAASEYGALVVVTSNYTDPFKIVEETPAERKTTTYLDTLSVMDPNFASIKDLVKNESAAKRDALRSRVAAAFKFILFEGRDRRIENSFWND